MTYSENIFELFKFAHKRDTPTYNKDWISSWSYQDQSNINIQREFTSGFYSYEGPHELAHFMNWSLMSKPDYFPDRLIRPLIERSTRLDRRVVKTHKFDFSFEKYEDGVARNNAQDYIMANAYPMAGPTHSRKILDFGAGSGRQANLWSQQEDEGLVFISVDGIPKPYCLQHFYYSNIDRPFYDYVVDDSNFPLNSQSRGIYHLPTWRFDLIPDNYLDKIIAVQVLPELSDLLMKYICDQFRRILKPSGILYIRDHKDLWKPVHQLDIDRYLSENGFTKEFEGHVEDKVDFFGIPRIYRKTNPRVIEQQQRLRNSSGVRPMLHNNGQNAISRQDWDQTPEPVRELLNQIVTHVKHQQSTAGPTLDRILKVREYMLRPRTSGQVMMLTAGVTARLYKHASSLKNLGWDVILICLDSSLGDDLSCFSQTIHCKNMQEVLDRSLEYTPQVYHIFTSWQFELPAFLIASGLHPVVFDNYDVLNGCIEEERPDGGPSERMLSLERYCAEHADALSLRDGRFLMSKRKVGIKPRKVALCLDGASSQMESAAFRLPKRMDGIHAVFVGNMHEPTSPRPRNFHFELARVLSNAGIHYHIYPSYIHSYNKYKPLLDDFVARYCRAGLVHLHKTLPTNQIIREISQYHFGIDIVTTSVNRVPGDHEFYGLETTEYAIDNKIFDYISAGLFTFVLKARWCQRIVERYNLGVRVTSFEDIVAQAKKRYLDPVPSIPKVLTTQFWAERLARLYNEIR